MRLHLRPLGVRQHESFHPKLESQPSQSGNPDSQQALALLWQIYSRLCFSPICLLQYGHR
jgi:hypothetical protein